MLASAPGRLLAVASGTAKDDVSLLWRMRQVEIPAITVLHGLQTPEPLQARPRAQTSPSTRSSFRGRNMPAITMISFDH
jgi:hypothetical protein